MLLAYVDKSWYGVIMRFKIKPKEFKAALALAGITQVTLAKRLDIDKDHLYRLINKGLNLHPKYFKAVCLALKVSRQEIIEVIEVVE